MTTEEAIKKAIEGGFNFDERNSHIVEQKRELWSSYHGDGVCTTSMFLDPSFWQSIGEALGWKEFVGENDFPSCGFSGGRDSFQFGDAEWKYQWHRFIDHLAEGKTAKSFFEFMR